MSKYRLDDLFRKKLKGRGFSPSDSAWAEMASKLDENRGGKKSGLWFLFIPLLLVLVGSVLYFMNGEVESEKTANSQETKQVDEQNKAKQTELVNEEVNVDSLRDASGIQETSSSTVQDRVDVPASMQQASTGDDRSGDLGKWKSAFGSGQGSSDPKATASLPEDIGKSSNSPKEVNTATIDQTSPAQAASQQDIQAPSGRAESSLPAVADQEPKEALNASSKKGKSSDLVLPQIGPTDLSDGKEAGNTEVEVDRTGFVAIPQLGPTPSAMKYEGVLLIPNDSSITSYVNDSKKWSYSLYPYFGQDRVSKTLSTGNSEWNGNLTYREAHESPLWKSTLGIQFEATKNNFGISTGFSLTEYGEEVDYQDQVTDSIGFVVNVEILYIDTVFEILVFDSIEMTTDTIYITEHLDSMEVFTVDSTIYSSSDNRSLANGVTTISYYEVPLLLSYSFHKKRWSFKPVAGISIGFLKGYRGSYLGMDSGLVAIGRKELILQQTLLSLNYGAQIGYDITERLRLQVGIMNKRNLGSIFEEKDYIQKYTTRGYRIGLQYFIGKP